VNFLFSSEYLCLPKEIYTGEAGDAIASGHLASKQSLREGLCPTGVNPKEVGRAKRGFAVHCKTSGRNGTKYEMS